MTAAHRLFLAFSWFCLSPAFAEDGGRVPGGPNPGGPVQGGPVQGGPIQVGQPLPEVRIAGDSQGELQIAGDEIRYVPWSPVALRGKPRIVYHIAARPGVDKIHAKLFDRITELDIDTERYVTLTLLNGDDVTFGVTSIARGELEKNKKKYPDGNFVFDGSSTAQKAWALQRKSSAVILVDENGVVLFFKDGALSDAEREQLLELVLVESGHPQ